MRNCILQARLLFSIHFRLFTFIVENIHLKCFSLLLPEVLCLSFLPGLCNKCFNSVWYLWPEGLNDLRSNNYFLTLILYYLNIILTVANIRINHVAHIDHQYPIILITITLLFNYIVI